MRAVVALVLTLVLVLSTPAALAGTPEAPEVTDPAGDCSFAPGNHYMDIVAVWISGETATDITVNIQLAEWIDPAGNGAGFAVDFQHQKVTWGVLAAYVAGQWSYGNGRVTDNGVEGWNDTTGSFQASPPVISVQFAKSNFPHDDPNDNQLVAFSGGSVDVKPLIPAFFSPVPPPANLPWIECDSISGDIPYVFQSGGHAGHGAPSSEDDESTTATPTGATPTSASPEAVAPAAAPADEGANAVPAPGLLALAAVLAVGFVLRRRK